MKCTNRAIQAAIFSTKCSCQCSCLGPDQDEKNNAFQRHFRCFLSLLQAESCRSLQDWRPGADFGICSSKTRPWVSLVLKWENAKWFPPIMKKDLGFLIRTAKKSSSLNDQNRMFSKGMSWHHPACCQLVAREWKIWWSVEIDLPAKTNLPASTSYNDVTDVSPSYLPVQGTVQLQHYWSCPRLSPVVEQCLTHKASCDEAGCPKLWCFPQFWQGLILLSLISVKHH